MLIVPRQHGKVAQFPGFGFRFWGLGFSFWGLGSGFRVHILRKIYAM